MLLEIGFDGHIVLSAGKTKEPYASQAGIGFVEVEPVNEGLEFSPGNISVANLEIGLRGAKQRQMKINPSVNARERIIGCRRELDTACVLAGEIGGEAIGALLIDQGDIQVGNTGRIIAGAYGPSSIATALRLESTVEEIVHAINAHPTMSEAVAEAAHAAHGAAIHM